MTSAGPLRILYVVSQWGAPTQTFVRREADAARAAGNTVVILSLKRPQQQDDAGVQVIHLRAVAPILAAWTVALHPFRSGRVVLRALRRSRRSTAVANLSAVVLGLAAAARVPPVHWIHAHFAWVAASAADAVAEVRGQRYSVFPHAFDIFDDRFVDDYTTVKLQRAAFVVVESPSIRDEVNERFRCDASVARMGVPPNLLAPLPVERGRAGDRIVSVGSLLPKKGHDVLLNALALLPPGVALTVIGEGPERAPLTQLARDLGVVDRVRFAGSLPERAVVAELDAADVFCLASRPTGHGDRDGVPNVLIESMARGTPCVSTIVSGIPDLLGEGRGLLVPPDDPTALADALRAVLEDPDRAASLGDAAHRHVKEEYLTDRNWTLLEDRIRAAIESGGVTDA